MCHSQLIERTNNEPVNVEHLHSRDVHLVISFRDWCHSVLRGPFSNSRLSSGVKLHMFCAWMSVSGYLLPSGLSNLFHHLLAAAILKEGTTVKRGPSDFGFVWMYLSKDMLNGVDWLKERWRRDDTLITHAPATCYIPHPFHVCHALKKFAEKLLWYCTNLRKFSSLKVSRYTVSRSTWKDLKTPYRQLNSDNLQL